jgi:uncharacterized RDD family membrane protein YckC
MSNVSTNAPDFSLADSGIGSARPRPQLNRGLQSSERAQPGRRFIAAWAYDYLACFWISFWLVAALDWIFNCNLTETMPLLVVTVVVFLTRDFFFEGRGVGKNLLGLQVLDAKNGNPASLKQSIVRNSVLMGHYLIYQFAVLIAFLLPLPGSETFIPCVKYAALTVGTILLVVEGYLMHKGRGLRIADRLAGTIVVKANPQFRNPFSRPGSVRHGSDDTD